MSSKWPVLQNIAVLAAVCFLFYLTRAWWPFLLLACWLIPNDRSEREE